MKLIKVSADHWQQENLCCAPSSNFAGVYHKKKWLTQSFQSGLVMVRTEEPVQAMIEYMPTEEAWLPLEAPNYMVILCFRVRDPHKRLGLGKQLLNTCLEDAKAKGKNGVVVLTTKTKKPFLSDGSFLKKEGFQMVDTALNDVELLCYQFNANTPLPYIRDCAKKGTIQQKGMVIYYTSQCVFTDVYVDLLQSAFKRQKLLLDIHHIQSKEEAQNAPCPFTTYSVFINGKFVTHEILREKVAQQLAKSFHL
ncbi:MAG: GNAT family N-acetyltransferase [Bacteriovoracaceae bacterium]